MPQMDESSHACSCSIPTTAHFVVLALVSLAEHESFQVLSSHAARLD